MTLVVGIDLGTTGLRSGVFDLSGSLLAVARSEFSLNSPHPGWAEQNPDEWWNACLRTLAQASGGFDPHAICGLAVVGQNPTLVCADENGNPTRRAILWADQRAVAEAKELGSRTDQVVDPSSLVAKGMWVCRHDPEAYRRTRWLLQSFDYLLFRLTGQPVTVASAPGSPGWLPNQFAEDSGLETSKLPQKTSQVTEQVGELLPAVAQKVGLKPGIPVIAGTIDSFAAWIGTATVRKGVVCNDCGATAGVALCWERPLSNPARSIYSVPHPVGQGWMVGSAMSCGSNLLDWFAQAFYAGADLEEVLADAEQIEPGCEGLVALPHLLGKRAPIEDPRARAVFLGIGTRHGRAHFARAVLEAVAYAVRDVCCGIEETGGQISEIRLAGGGARSPLWNRIKAGVLGKKMVVPQVVDSALLGSAMIAAAGVGVFPSLFEAAKNMFRPKEVIEPDTAVQPLYNELFEVYREMDRNLRPVFARLSQTPETH